MTIIGLVGAGHMGSGLGAALRDGGHEVVTTLEGRSARTVRLVREAGIDALPNLNAVVSAAAVLLVVTPPGSAVDAAMAIAGACLATGAHPLVADLNAVSPSTMERVKATLAEAGLELVDGSISGPPPTVRPGAAIYLSGPRAGDLADLGWRRVNPIVVSDRVGDASAVKMCTASVYKGAIGIVTQALWAAAHYGVAHHVLADLGEDGYRPAAQIPMAATKAWRFVPEMHEIAATQAAAGLSGGLFEAMAGVYEHLARTELARQDPEAVDDGMSAAALVERLGG